MSNRIFYLCLVVFTYICNGSVIAQPILKSNDSGKVAHEIVNADYAPSTTKDGGWEKVAHIYKPIPWQPIREKDILWLKRVWREIDVNERQNMVFTYEGDEHTGGGMFADILLYHVQKGTIKAYDINTDYFSRVLTKDEIARKVAPSIDSTEVEDPVTNVVSRVAITRSFRPELIRKYRIKEDWIFDGSTGKMVVRILGIAPIIDVYSDEGAYKGPQTLFWLYYPDIRWLLAQYEVVSNNNDANRMTWDEFFESRAFSSKITKVSNSLNRKLEDLHGIDDKGKMEQLYEGKNVSEGVFDKEHNHWEY